MSNLSSWRAWVRAMVHRDALDRDLDRELAAWIDELAARYESRGLTPEAARRRALADTGRLDHVKDRVRDVRPRPPLESTLNDAVYAFRSLARSPGVLGAIVVTLALGIGANTAVYSAIRTLLVQPPPYRDPDRLALVLANMAVAGVPRARLAGPEIVDFQLAASKLGAVAALQPASAALTGEGEPEQLRVAHVTWNFFDVLGATAARGRTFAEEDGRPQPSPPVIVSWPLFQRRFGADPAAVGRRILLNGGPATIVGVLPPAFRLQMPPDLRVPDDVQVFQPFRGDLAQGHRLLRYYWAIARVADGAAMADAAHEVEAIGSELARRYPGYTPARHTFYLVPLLSDSTREARPMLMALLGGVLVVLVAACANVAGLLLARAAGRRREIATLIALGADRRRLVRQFAIEGLLIAGLGALAGVAAGFPALRAMVALRPPGLDLLQHASIDTPVLLTVAAVACVWGVLFAFAPLAELGSLGVPAGLQRLSSAAGRVRPRTRSALVVAQIALGTVLVVAAGLLVRTMDALHHVDAGFDLDARALTFRLSLPALRYPSSAVANAFTAELEARLCALPGVSEVGAVSHLPFDEGGNWASKYFTETSERNLALARAADTRSASPGLLRALGMQLTAGRWFTDGDDHRSAPVVVVDERLASRAWPNSDAVGQRLHVPFVLDRQVRTTWATVIGVVRHVRYRTPDAEVQEQVYFSAGQNLRDAPTAFVIRSKADPSLLAAEVRRVVAALDPQLPAYDMWPLERYVARALSGRRFTAVLVSSFATLAVALAGVGLAGLLGYLVSSRRRELGIRAALGATPARVGLGVFAEGLGLVSWGIGIGLVGAAAAANGMRTLLYGVGPADLASYGSALILLCSTGLVAGWWPARRAMRVNLVELLRSE